MAQEQRAQLDSNYVRLIRLPRHCQIKLRTHALTFTQTSRVKAQEAYAVNKLATCTLSSHGNVLTKSMRALCNPFSALLRFILSPFASSKLVHVGIKRLVPEP